MAAPNPLRRMLVNADDFGETDAITHGILDCAAVGSVRSASVIVTTDYWEQAKTRLDPTGALDFGIHFNLTSGRPVAEASRLAAILEPDGRFALPGETLRRLVLHPQCARAVEAELLAQTQRLADTGVHLTHANFNDHLFFLPMLWRICRRVCEAFAIPYLRHPYQARSRHPLWSGQGRKRLFLNAWFFGRARRSGAIPVNSFDSLGQADMAGAYRDILAAWPELGELVVHPGRIDAAVNDDFQKARVHEHAFLATDALPSLAAAAGVSLIGFRDLCGADGAPYLAATR